MKKLFKKLLSWFSTYEYDYLEYTKEIFNSQRKTQAEIFQVLHQELETRKAQVPQHYVFKQWSGPLQGKKGQLIYIMVFERKTRKQ